MFPSLTHRDLMFVSGLFWASTAAYWVLGVRFDAYLLSSGMQFIDPALLRERLLESLWFYHANPPLLNLFAGIGLKFFGGATDWYFSICFHALGWLVAIVIFTLTRELSESRDAALIATALLVFSPSFVLYENWLLYTFPTMALLAIATLLLYRFMQTLSGAWCLAFFATLAALLLLRSLFHLAWMIAVAGLLAAALRGHRRRVLLAAALPVLVVAAWYGKNDFYFGRFSASTWMGIGLSNITTLGVPLGELVPLYESGALSSWAFVSRYENTDALFSSGQRPPTGVPVLDQVRKQDGSYNYNYRDIPVVDRYYVKDALTVARAFPAHYLAGVFAANYRYFSPTSMNEYFSPANRSAVRHMERVLNPVLAGTGVAVGFMEQPHFGRSGKYFVEVNPGFPLMAVWALLWLFGYVQARSAFLSADPAIKARAVVMGFIVLTAVYLYGVSTTLEFAENNRYRFNIEPLMLVLAATAVTRLVRWARARRAGGDARRTSGPGD